MSDMVQISIEGVEHTLTIEAAHGAMKRLSDEIRRAKRARADALVNPVPLNEHGRFNKLYLRKFFSGVYEGTELTSRSGKLFNMLCSLAVRIPNSIVVIHDVPGCGRHLNQPCTLGSGTQTHNVTKDAIGQYWMDARSVVRNQHILDDLSVRGVGDKMLDDFQLLLGHLPVP